MSVTKVPVVQNDSLDRNQNNAKISKFILGLRCSLYNVFYVYSNGTWTLGYIRCKPKCCSTSLRVGIFIKTKYCRALATAYAAADAACALIRWPHVSAWNGVTSSWKSVSVNRCVFNWRTILSNFIPIRFETTEHRLFWRSRPNRKRKKNNNKMGSDMGWVSYGKCAQLTKYNKLSLY